MRSPIHPVSRSQPRSGPLEPRAINASSQGASVTRSGGAAIAVAARFSPARVSAGAAPDSGTGGSVSSGADAAASSRSSEILFGAAGDSAPSDDERPVTPPSLEGVSSPPLITRGRLRRTTTAAAAEANQADLEGRTL